MKRRRLRFHNLNLRLICFKTQLKEYKKGVGLCCTHSPYSMILVANLTLVMVNLLCVPTSAMFVLNCFLIRMLFLLVASTCTTLHQAYYVNSHACCKVNDCKKTWQLNWLLSMGIWPMNEDALMSLRAQSLACMSWVWKLKDKLATLGKVLLVLNLLNLC